MKPTISFSTKFMKKKLNNFLRKLKQKDVKNVCTTELAFQEPPKKVVSFFSVKN